MKLNPSKIIAVGLNYTDHAEELKMPLPDEPVIFLKPTTTLIYNNDEIIYPPQTKELHYEAELAIIISKKAKDIDERNAVEYILGFTCGNDVTARDLQRKDGQWTRAKSFNTFCPIGPKIVKNIDPTDLDIKLFLNGELKQSSNTNKMIFSPYFIVSYISNIMTLFPEDIILTGTPKGVGEMEVGDTVEVEISGIGKLSNKVVKKA
jgi:2-keto-4-pentenoate hydratase/2-oxohepta-3-ene-1,7-dioic acid hydratase in catechol pathway